MPLTGDSQVNKKAFGIAINSRKVVRFHPHDREKTVLKLLPRLCWIAHERRRDLARFDGSWDRASMMFQRCFLAVETKERISAKSIAPCNDRKPPEIF